MVKRARSSGTDSEAVISDPSESSDASFKPATKKRNKKAKVTQTKRFAMTRVRKALHPEESDAETLPTVDDRHAHVGLHPAKNHVIVDPLPIREKLLTWYASVHEARGMPWRKPYDPTLNRDQRAQRAYEVSVITSGLSARATVWC
jgi:A/G-specific adenine glycosylase